MGCSSSKNNGNDTVTSVSSRPSLAPKIEIDGSIDLTQHSQCREVSPAAPATTTSQLDLTQHSLSSRKSMPDGKSQLDLTQHSSHSKYGTTVESNNLITIPLAESSYRINTTEVKLQYYGKCRKGHDDRNPRKPNQDMILFMHQPPVPGSDAALQSFVWVVMDGHGQFGHEVVAFCKDYLEINLFIHHLFNTDLSAAVRDTFLQMDAALAANGRVDTNFSGTTAVLAALRGTKLLVANVGDSRALLAKRHDEMESKVVGRPLKCEQLTTDHKASLPEESARILASNGRVLTDAGGLARIYLPTVKMPGLAMSRSIGDSQVHGFGVSPDPQIVEVDIAERILHVEGTEDSLNKNIAMLILGTDGIFDLVVNDDIAAALFPTALDFKQQSQEEYCSGLDLDSSTSRHDSIHSENKQGTPLTAAVADAVDRLVDDTHKKWLSQVGLADDISLVAVAIACSMTAN